MKGRPLLSNNNGLKAKVLEQSSVANDAKGSHRACVVAMAKSVANGYAAALAEVGQSKSNLDSISGDIAKLSHFCEDKTFYDFFTSPVVKDEHKKEVVKSLSKEAKFTTATLNLLTLLVTKKRTMILKDLIKEFEDIYNKMTDTQLVYVTSAVEIQESQLAQISEKVQSMSGCKNIKIKNVIDPSIIAGFIIRFGEDGSRLIDMSVKGQLDKIASQIELSEQAAVL
ncbi:hypothetical protein KP509_36G009700 [Ceratopteris richardii]|nr:hypothetical protein KP509_36G009700 [Ceratopteris richardii]